jgi:hypothetical protein
MRMIKDNQGNQYELHIGIDEYRKVRAALGVDLAMHNGPGKTAGTLSMELYNSTALFLDVLFELVNCRDANKKLKKSDFDAAFFGECLPVVREEFFGEWSDFFRFQGATLDARILENVPRGMAMLLSKGLAMQEEELGLKSIPSSSDTPEFSKLNVSAT